MTLLQASLISKHAFVPTQQARYPRNVVYMISLRCCGKRNKQRMNPPTFPCRRRDRVQATDQDSPNNAHKTKVYATRQFGPARLASPDWSGKSGLPVCDTAEVGIFVVIRLVIGATVVPGMVPADEVDAAMVLPDTVVIEMTRAETVRGSNVVPGTIVVYVWSPPSALAAIALPTPLLVYGVGMSRTSGLGWSFSLPL